MVSLTHASPMPPPPSSRPLVRLLRAGRLLLALSGAAVATEVAALEFECSVPGDTRHLRVDLPGEDHLCEVSVTGPDEERRVMWYADHETLYCSAKAYELRDKYVNTWEFDCTEWPDRDGVDRLSARHRAILDIQLKSLLARADAGESRLAASGVRAVASTPLERRDGFLALQFFLADGTDLVRVVVDEDDGWTTLLELEDLASRVSPLEGFTVTDAFVDGIGDSGALEVVTLLVAEGSATQANGGTSVCEGRQTLLPDVADGLVPLGAHRHVCDGAAD